MSDTKRNISYGFGTRLTRLGKRLLIIYAMIYVVELLFEHWLGIPFAADLQLHPLQSGDFRIWQFLTHPFIHDPRSPLGFVVNGIVLYFFAAPVEHAFGSKRFLILFYISAAGAALFGIFFSMIPGFGAPFSGMLPSLLSLIVIFGLLSPEATILLMFILPIKAKYLSYGTVLITFLTFLAKANPHGAYHLGGILLGYIYFKGPRTLFDPNLIRLRYLQWQLKKSQARSRMAGDPDNKDDGKPTIH